MIVYKKETEKNWGSGQTWRVEVELCQVFPADELVWNEGVPGQPVPVQVDSGGVHGDELRDPTLDKSGH